MTFYLVRWFRQAVFKLTIPVFCVLWAPLAADAEPIELPEGSSLFGQTGTYEAMPGDTLTNVAERTRLGLAALVAANPDVDPWLLDAGVTLTLPVAHLLPEADRSGIVINLPEQRLYHYLADGRVQSFAVSAGNPDCELEPGQTSVAQRRRQPSWKPSAEVRSRRPDLPARVPPGPRNPLGKYALDLKQPGLIIHGAPRPFSGREAEGYGCVELYSADMIELYQASRAGTPITVIDQPIKLGWADGELYLEAHPTRDQVAELSELQRTRYAPAPGFDARLEQAAGNDLDRVDQELMRRMLRERTGIPAKITFPRPPPKVKKVRGLFGN